MSDEAFEGNVLPEFPIDDNTLDLLWTAMHPGPDADRTSVGDFLRFMSELGGSDVNAVAKVIDDGSDGGAAIHMMRDMQYHEHDVLRVLVEEVRRLRKDAAAADQRGYERAIEVLRPVLVEHFLFSLNCDHEAKADTPWCGCAAVDLGTHPTVGDAVQAWVDHVMSVASSLVKGDSELAECPNCDRQRGHTGNCGNRVGGDSEQ